MAPKTIENMTQLNEFAVGVKDELSVIKTANEAVPETIEAAATERKALGEKVDKLSKQFGDLIIVFKKRWEDEDTPHGENYRFGKFMWALQRNDVQAMVNMGARKVNDKVKNDLVIDKDFMDKAIKLYGEGKMGVIPDEQKTDFGTPLMGDSGTGQYLLPQNIYATDILRLVADQSELIPKLMNVPMAGRQILYPAEGTRFSFTARTSESGDTTESNPTFAQITLTAETYAGWVGMSDELLEDTFMEIGGLLRTQAVEAMVDLIETKVIKANNDDSLNVYGMLYDSAITNIQTMDTNSFSDLKWSDLANLKRKLTTSEKRRRAYFIMHPTVFDILAADLDGVGRYYFDPSTGGPRSIWGYPYIMSDNAPDEDESAASTPFIAFCNPKHYLHGTRLGLTFGFYPGTYYKVQNLENFFLAVTRQAFEPATPAAIAYLKTSA